MNSTLFFTEAYKDAEIKIKAVGAREAIVDFINDSIRVVASARPLNSEELAILKNQAVEYHEYFVAFDGVAVLLNKKNLIEDLRIKQLDSIL